MIWLFVGMMLVVVVALILSRLHSSSEAMTNRATVELYAIRRRQEVSRFNLELRRNAANVRRRLLEELSELDRRDGDTP